MSAIMRFFDIKRVQGECVSQIATRKCLDMFATNVTQVCRASLPIVHGTILIGLDEVASFWSSLLNEA